MSMRSAGNSYSRNLRRVDWTATGDRLYSVRKVDKADVYGLIMCAMLAEHCCKWHVVRWTRCDNVITPSSQSAASITTQSPRAARQDRKLFALTSLSPRRSTNFDVWTSERRVCQASNERHDGISSRARSNDDLSDVNMKFPVVPRAVTPIYDVVIVGRLVACHENQLPW